MDYQELIFASHVYSLARDILRFELQQHMNSIDQGEDRAKVQAEWLFSNPNKNFVPEALARIQAVAQQIKQLSE
jgi:hypothetical protein